MSDWSRDLAEVRVSIDDKLGEIWAAVEKMREKQQDMELRATQAVTGLSSEMNAMRASVDRLDRLMAFGIRVMIVGIVVVAASTGPQGIQVIAKLFGVGP